MIEIKHLETGAVLHTVDGDTLSGADLSGAHLSRAYLRGADLTRANLTGADLSEADLTGANLSEADLSGAHLRRAYLTGAYLSEAYLRGANLSEADLSGAHLRGADLSGAHLSRAYLSRAYLRGAKLSEATICEDKLDRLLARATRSDGHEFFLFSLQGALPKIKVGCRWMTIAEYRDHVAKEYPDTDKAKETLRILDYFDACSATLSAMPPPELRVGVFVLRPSPNGIWIGRDGEGGEFATEHVERVIAQYYREQF